MLLPSVLTMSASSTPFTWVSVLEWAGVAVEVPDGAATVVVPAFMGGAAAATGPAEPDVRSFAPPPTP